jgi:hypothetical protein
MIRASEIFRVRVFRRNWGKWMNLFGLGRLGKVAGIGGLCIAGVFRAFDALIGTIPGLPLDRQADIVWILAILSFLSFVIGVIGIIAWVAVGLLASRSVPTSTPSMVVMADRGSIAAGRDIRDVDTASRKTKV